MKHIRTSPFAGKTVKIAATATHILFVKFGGSELEVQDWADRCFGQIWTLCAGNAHCQLYGLRASIDRVPVDCEIVFGTISGVKVMVHVSEIAK